MFNHVTVAGVISLVIELGNHLVPILPPVWANLLSAIIAVYTLYYGGKAVSAGRAAGIKGV